jgi:hypothetical protein
MTGLEVFSLVQTKRKRIEDLFDPTTFVLNKEVQQLQEEIYNLQKECPHEYENHICKFCGKEE